MLGRPDKSSGHIHAERYTLKDISILRKIYLGDVSVNNVLINFGWTER
jgi:hypothetical protein